MNILYVQDMNTYGGSFLYHLEGTNGEALVAIGIVVRYIGKKDKCCNSANHIAIQQIHEFFNILWTLFLKLLTCLKINVSGNHLTDFGCLEYSQSDIKLY